MTTEIRFAAPSELDAVTAYLGRAFHGGPSSRYRSFLEYTWMPDKPDLGVLLEDGGQIRGFVGALYADRARESGLFRSCNLTTIAVDESHRGHTLRLFGALLKRKELTYTCFSPSEQVEKILQFFKFEHHASERVLVGPLSGLAGLPRALFPQRTHVLTDRRVFATELDPTELGIARDHDAYRCAQFLIIRGERRCFVVAVRRGRGRLAFADVLYATDPSLLVESLPWIHLPIFRALGTVITGIDRRWVSHPPAISVPYKKLRPIYVRSPVQGVRDIDLLYSELVPMSGRASS